MSARSRGVASGGTEPRAPMNHVVEQQPARFLRGELVCPRCGNDTLEAVSDGIDHTNFLCRECWTCWYWQLGYLSRILVDTCPGCYHKPECLRRRSIA